MQNTDSEAQREFTLKDADVIGCCIVDPDTPHETQKTLAFFQLIYSLVALALGLVCIIGGIILFLRGATSWTASFLGVESKISDASPGAVLFIVGLFIVFITKYKFEHRQQA